MQTDKPVLTKWQPSIIHSKTSLLVMMLVHSVKNLGPHEMILETKQYCHEKCHTVSQL
jgi:hypothetical protein